MRTGLSEHAGGLSRTLAITNSPYSCRLSDALPVIEILFEGDLILNLPITREYTHKKIVDALNGAYKVGALRQSQVEESRLLTASVA
jgi:hypothetical protein